MGEPGAETPDANTASAAATNSLSYDEFVAHLPSYKYNCDIDQYFKDERFVKAYGHLRHPNNSEFNARLANMVPRLLYISIQRLREINPGFAENVYQNAQHLPFRFICTHYLTEVVPGGVAYTRKHFWLFGKETVNLGALAYQLVEGAVDDEELTYFNHTFFHEFLHQASLPNHKTLMHDKMAVKTGGKNDVVYSCSNYSWRPEAPDLTPLEYTNDDEGNNRIEPFELNSFYIHDYIKKMSSPNELKELDKERREYPERSLIHVFDYNQCMTCALVRVAHDKAVRSDDAKDVAAAEKYCSENAVKVTTRNVQMRK